MDSKEMSEMFRAGELKRREARLNMLANYAKLEKEPLGDFDRAVDEAAQKAIRQQRIRFEKSIRPGYFERLWAAIWGR